MKRFTVVLMMLGFASCLWATPAQITYQGTLKEGGVPASGSKTMKFEVLSNGQSVWTQQATVTVVNGLFSAVLTPTNVDWANLVNPQLQVTINGQVLAPAEAIAASPYSLVANTVVDGAITSAKLADGSVTAAKLDTSIQTSGVPSGTVVAFAGATPPTGWLVCDGSAVSRTAYPSLFSAIGVIWGVGDSVSTFNLPDLRGRTAIGAGQGTGLSSRTVGQTLGEENHMLSINEMPSHNHGVNDPGHNHGLYFGTPGGGDNNFAENFGVGLTNTQTQSAVTGITIQNNGGGAAHNNMQPSAVVSYIIKI